MNQSFLIWLWIAFVIMVIIISYNKIVKLWNITQNAFADIDVWMKKRFDLVSNLVEVVKWYTKHESSVFEKISTIRTAFTNAWSNKEKIESNDKLTASLKSFFAVSEKYPDLKASHSFLDLQKKLSKMEDTIAQSRRYYNATVREYNNMLQVFPTNILSKIFSFKLEKFWDIENEHEKKLTKVNL